MLLPLQRSSMFLPGGRFVVWPRRRKRPLSKTWVSRDWPLPPPSLGLGCRTFTRFPPGLMRFSPTSFLRLTCWQSPGYTQEKEKGGGEQEEIMKKTKISQISYYCSESADLIPGWDSRGSDWWGTVSCSLCFPQLWQQLNRKCEILVPGTKCPEPTEPSLFLSVSFSQWARNTEIERGKTNFQGLLFSSLVQH